MRHQIFTICAGLALATPGIAQDATQGQGVYLQYCATCHAVDATGNGPMAPALVVQPPDLTTLAAQNGGVFPTTRVVWRIDGRDPLVAHGSPMPVWALQSPITTRRSSSRAWARRANSAVKPVLP